MAQDSRLKNADKLLSDIVSGLKDLEKQKGKVDFRLIEVKFIDNGKVLETLSLVTALDAISNDLVRFDGDDFSEATRAAISTF